MGDNYLRFWGVRGSYASPFASHMKVGGNTSCVEIRAGDYLLVCDAGTGIIPLGQALLEQQNIRQLLVVLTHYHWDHICGLPFFAPAFMPDWKIGFYGPGQTVKDVEKALSTQMQSPYFPISTESWVAQIRYLPPETEKLKYGPLTIEHYNVQHPGITYGYRISIAGKTIVYVSDNECRYLARSLQQLGKEFNIEERTIYQAVHKEEQAAELSLIENADILIHDAQYTEEDYVSKRGWGHSCFKDTIHSAIDANVKTLYLYHHDPRYDDQAMEAIYADGLQIIAERDSDLQCHIAREGLTVDLN